MELVIVAAIAIVQFLIFDGVVAAPPPPTVAAAAPLAAVSTTHSTAIDADILVSADSDVPIIFLSVLHRAILYWVTPMSTTTAHSMFSARL